MGDSVYTWKSVVLLPEHSATYWTQHKLLLLQYITALALASPFWLANEVQGGPNTVFFFFFF